MKLRRELADAIGKAVAPVRVDSSAAADAEALISVIEGMLTKAAAMGQRGLHGPYSDPEQRRLRIAHRLLYADENDGKLEGNVNDTGNTE